MTKTEAPKQREHETGVQYPEDGCLRGYFLDTASDRREGASIQRVTGIRKNIDFMRLRDVGLHLLDPRPGQTILDVGCKDGAMMICCGLQGAEVYGQDTNRDHVAKANEFLKRFGLQGEAKVGDAAFTDFPNNAFDGAISSDFFEHVTDEKTVHILRELLRILKPGGVLVIKTPNLQYLKLSLVWKRLRAVLRFQNPLNFVIAHTPETADPQHIGLKTRHALSRCLTEAGFLNYQFSYAPLRRFGQSGLVETLSTEIPVVRDWLCEDLFCRAYKPIALAHFPD